VLRILCAYKDSGSLSPNRNGKRGRRWKTTPRNEKQCFTSNNDIKDFRTDIVASTVRRRLVEVGQKARKINEKAIFDTCFEAETVDLCK
jgi:hypothetical protein